VYEQELQHITPLLTESSNVGTVP